jgi:hypothetical protein
MYGSEGEQMSGLGYLANLKLRELGLMPGRGRQISVRYDAYGAAGKSSKF